MFDRQIKNMDVQNDINRQGALAQAILAPITGGAAGAASGAQMPGGAGAFLLRDAIAANADCFVCGEFHYHDYFENSGTLLAELGHYQSEQFTIDLICDILSNTIPELEIIRTNINTNPTYYL